MNQYLSNQSIGRNNNLNLIRFTLAFLVLFSHSFPLINGQSYTPNVIGGINISLGDIAVDIFFILSGFLITKSFIYSKSLGQYIKSRALRIYPAVITMTLFCIVLGAFYTSLSTSEYFLNTEVIKFLINNSTLLFGIEHTLPHVFNFNPFPNEVNGSLWTLRYEIKMYALIAIVYSSLLYLSKIFNFVSIRKIILVFTVLVLSFYICSKQFDIVNSHYPRLVSMFFIGVSYYLWAEKIKLTTMFFILCVAVLFVSSIVPNAFLTIYCLTLPVIVFYLSYIPRGLIRKYNNLGDYSYGFYIYAFPVQQAIVASNPNISIIKMIVLSFCITLTLAVLSWHFIEIKFIKNRKVNF